MNRNAAQPATRTKTMTTAHPRRRFFRYSLRTLMLAVTVFCIWMAIATKQARDQRQAVEAIRELGGMVIYDYQLAGSEKPARPEWLGELIGDDYFARVVFVRFLGTPATDADLVHLEGLRGLQGLSLLGTEVTDAGLAHVEAYTSLETLDLTLTDITDAGLVHLKHLTKLRKLGLSNTSVTDAGVDALRKALPDAEIRHDLGIDTDGPSF